MRIRIVLALSMLLAIAGATLPSLADDCLGICRDFKRRNCWPEPFVAPDRQAVREPMAIMIAHGWERQNMLHEQYFEDGKSTLNEAGRLKIRWILNEAPSTHRVVYVRRADNPADTQARIESVHAYMAQLQPGTMQAPVLETNMSPPSWPADRMDVLNRKFFDAIPAPKLSGDSGGSGGSGQ
jgi:hypothetical protein